MRARKSKPRKQVSGVLLVLFFASLATMALFVLAFQARSSRPRSYSDSGLDLNNVELPAETAQTAQPAAMDPQDMPASDEAPDSGSLGMIRGAGDIRTGTGGRPRSAAKNTKEAAAGTITRLIRANELRYQRIAEEYSKKYPLLRQYGADWMSYPDLKRYNDQYFVDHDPIKFAWNVARSPNFATLVKKYSGQQAVMAVITEFARQTPAELAEAGQNYLAMDSNAMKLVQKFSSALGVPPEIFGGLAAGKIDPNHAASATLSQNAQLQQLLQQNNVDPGKLNTGFGQ